MKLFVHSADYGMTDSITDGCLHAIRNGILRDVGLMTNNDCAARAAEEIKKYPFVSVGQEINMVGGKPVTNPELVPSLVNEEGRFMTSRERMAKFPGDKNYGITYEDAYLETENQVKRFIELIGRKPLYIMGHALMSENVEKARIAVAEKYGLLTDLFGLMHSDMERWYKDYPQTKQGFTADLQLNTDVEGYIVEDKGDLLNHEYSMLSTHCGFADKEVAMMSSFHLIRGVECSALVSPRVKQWIKDNNIELINLEQFFKETGKEY